MAQHIAPLDRLPADVRELVGCVTNLLTMYMPGTTKIEMLVGRNIKATLSIEGGPLTREAIEDTMAHLAFYKKYFAKTPAEEPRLDSPEKIIAAVTAAWEAHRAAMPADEIAK